MDSSWPALEEVRRGVGWAALYWGSAQLQEPGSGRVGCWRWPPGRPGAHTPRGPGLGSSYLHLPVPSASSVSPGAGSREPTASAAGQSLVHLLPAQGPVEISPCALQ